MVKSTNSIGAEGYQGDWAANNCHGYGVMTYADGKVYKGMWEEGFHHGQGTLINTDGSEFSG